MAAWDKPTWYDNYRELKQKEEEKKNKTKAPRALVQYEDNAYRGESATRKSSYEWEKKELSELPIKEYGRSYNDKFKAWATSQGIPEWELGEFRRFLDSREDDKDLAGEKLDRGFSDLKQRRQEVMDNRASAKVRREKEKEQEKQVQAKREQQGERDGFLGFMDRTAGRASRSAQEWLLGEDFVTKQDEIFRKNTNNEDIEKMVNTTSREAEGALETGADIAGVIAGGLAPYAAGYGAANSAMRGIGALRNIQNPIAKDAVRGALAGGGVGLGLSATRTAAGEDMSGMDYAKLIGGEAVLGGAFDAGIGVIGRKIAQRLAKGETPEQIIQAEGTTPEEVQHVAQEFEKLLGPNPPISGPQQASMDTFVPESIPTVEEPNPALFDDLFNFASSNRSEVSPRGAQPKANVSRGDRELIGNMGEGILKREQMLDGTHNNQLLDVQKRMDDLARQEADDALLQQQEIFQRRQAEEDAFVEQRKQPLDELMEMVSQADAEWTRVKQSKDIIKNLKQSYGKIIIPESNWADWGNEIPPAFRAKKGETKGVDIYRFADDLGMSPDEAVQYLKSLDADSKLKKKDLISDDLPKMDEKKYEETLDLFRKEFQQTDTAKGLDKMFEDLYGIVNDRNPDELYSRVRQDGEPESFDEMLRLATMDANKDNPVSLPLDELLRRDPAIKEGIQGLFPPRQSRTPQPDQPRAEFDDLLAFMNQETATPSTRVEPQATVSSSSEQVTPEKSDRLLRMNLQRFNPTETNPMINASENPQTEKALDMQKNPVKRGWSKFREHYINRNESFKTAEENVLKSRLVSLKEKEPELREQLSKAKTDVDKKSIKEQLDQIDSIGKELKGIKKNGSNLEKAVANESAADAQTKDFLNRHFGNMFKAAGGDEQKVSKALEYVMSKRLLWRRDNDPAGMKDYQLPKGWDWERLKNVEAAGDSQYGDFVTAVQGAKQEQLDKMLTYGLIDETSYNNLMEDPYYIPMYRDRSYMSDNVDSGWGVGQNSNRRGADPYVLHEWGSGDTSSFFKNPLETMVSNAYAVNKNALKNDTAQQMLRLAQMDDEGSLFKEISAKDYSQVDGGGIEVFVDGQKRYVKPQKDMMDLIKENDAGLVSDMASRVTGMIAGLKTRSFEYQTAAALRDTMESYIKSQAGPVQWFEHAFNAVKSKQANAKEVGAYFEHAWKDHFGGINPQEITKEYTKQHKNVKMFDYKSSQDWKEVAKSAGKALDIVFKPSKALGQYLDNLPREIEVMEATRRFNAQNADKIAGIQDELGQIAQAKEAAEQATGDFTDATKGIDDLILREDALKSELNQLQRDLRRDQIYQGRDIMNYSRTGRGELTKFIRKYVMFANTTTQSKDKLVRSFMERPVATMTKAAVAVGPMFAMQRLAYEGMNDKDRETYNNLPNYMKQSNFVFVDNGKVTAIAKPHELALLVNPIEAHMSEEPLNASLKTIAKELVPYQGGHLAQGLVPDEEGKTLLDRDGFTKVPEGVTQPSTALSPIVDVVANDKIGFNRKPISYDAEEANKWTLDVSKKAAGDTPNADALEYLVRQYGGDAGKYGVHTLDWLLEPKNEDKLDALLRNLNPLQDRYYAPNSRFFKEPIQESKKN